MECAIRKMKEPSTCRRHRRGALQCFPAIKAIRTGDFPAYRRVADSVMLDDMRALGEKPSRFPVELARRRVRKREPVRVRFLADCGNCRR